jgi:hypothetical protein
MTARNPLQLKAPASLTRAEKAEFRRLSEHVLAGKTYPRVGLADVLADYVRLRTRIDHLSVERAKAVRDNSPMLADKARILAIGRDLNSAASLSLKLAEQLGI